MLHIPGTLYPYLQVIIYAHLQVINNYSTISTKKTQESHNYILIILARLFGLP